MRYALLFCLVGIGWFDGDAQSPWVAGKNKGFVQFGFSAIGPYSGLFLDGSESFTLNRQVSDRTLQLYGEYGIAEKTSLLAVLPFKMMATGSTVSDPTTTPTQIEEGNFSTIGNIQLAIRQNFINSQYVLSGQLGFELPAAGFDESTGLRGGLDAFSIIPSISIGAGSKKVYGYLSAGVAIRTNDYSSEFRLGGEAGYQVLNRIYAIVVLDVVSNFENGNAVDDIRQIQTGMYLNNQSFFAYGLKGIIGFTDNIGLTAGYYGAASGNVVARSPSLNAGVYYKW